MQNAELREVSQWMTDKRLSLHFWKKESILFGSKIRLKKASTFKVLAGDSEIKAKESVSYLGSVLDCHLTGVGQTQIAITK